MRKFFANLEELISAFFLTIMVLVLVGNVCMRITMSKSLLWMEEIAYLCFAWVVFVGAAAAYKRNLHSSIDMVVRLFPLGIRSVVAVTGMLFTLAACVVMVVLSLTFSLHAWEKYTPFLYIRYTFIDISVTVGFLFMCVHCLAFLRNMIRYGDFVKERQLYANIWTMDVLMSGTAETTFHEPTDESAVEAKHIESVDPDQKEAS